MKLRRNDKFKRIIKFIVQHYNTINNSTMIEIQNNIHEIYDRARILSLTTYVLHKSFILLLLICR